MVDIDAKWEIAGTRFYDEDDQGVWWDTFWVDYPYPTQQLGTVLIADAPDKTRAAFALWLGNREREAKLRIKEGLKARVDWWTGDASSSTTTQQPPPPPPQDAEVGLGRPGLVCKDRPQVGGTSPSLTVPTSASTSAVAAAAAIAAAQPAVTAQSAVNAHPAAAAAAAAAHPAAAAASPVAASSSVAALPVVKFRSDFINCSPYALLNLVGNVSPDLEDRLLGKGDLVYADLSRLTAALRQRLGKPKRARDGTVLRPAYRLSRNLYADKDVFSLVAWLLTRTTGLYIVASGRHCVGLDCARGLVFDCGNTHAVPAVPAALHINASTTQRRDVQVRQLTAVV